VEEKHIFAQTARSKNYKELIKREFTRQAERVTQVSEFADEEILNLIAQAVGGGKERVLDVACGAGFVAFKLAEFAKEVIGIDITGGILAKARQLRDEKRIKNVFFELADAEALPFEDRSFDAVVCRFAIHHFPNPQIPLKEMTRVIKEDGKVVIMDIISSENKEEARLHNALEKLRDPSHSRMLCKSELETILGECGLRVEKIQEGVWEHSFDEWIAIINQPHREPSLRVVMEELAKAGIKAGINLRIENSILKFDHHYILLNAKLG
jgi:ubiquinone/menaquinone biosynthesis C-methylase UbiE